MKSIDDKCNDAWNNISKLFEASSKAEQDLIKSVFDYAYRSGYNTGYAAGLTDDIIHRVAGGEDDVLADN